MKRMPKDGHAMKVAKPAMHKPGHPRMRHDEMMAKKATKAVGKAKGLEKHGVTTVPGTRMGKTPKGRSGGGFPLKKMTGHVPMGNTKSGRGMGRKKKMTEAHVAKALSRIK